MRNAAVLVAMLVTAAACRPAAEDGMPRGGEAADPVDLVASLDVRFRGGTAEIGLHVLNALDEPVDLEFATAQRYDFAVYTAAGDEVWRWSADRVFAQVTGTERLEAGGALEYRESWPAGVAAGQYIAEARLLAQNRPIRLRTELDVAPR